MASLARLPSPSAHTRTCRSGRRPALVVMNSSTKTAKITVVKNCPEEQLKRLGVRSWPTWGCGVSKFPWSYSETEQAYILEGEVVVTPTGGEPVEIKAGDFCSFPAGMSCTWDVKKAINKHYNFL